MAEPYIGEIRLVGFNFAPVGWALCDGQTIPISQNETLYNLIGTTYGGDGVQTFNLPDLRGRVPVDMGSSTIIGQRAGSEEVTLQTSNLPPHSHPLVGSTGMANSTTVANNVQATTQSINIYTSPKSVVATTSGTTLAGQSLPHANLQPFLVVNFILSLYGIYPSPG
jgi:microcystin-dependent protein